MPKLGLTMNEAMINEWRVAKGDAFSVGDVLFVVETEKVSMEVQAEYNGVIDVLLVAAGDVVPVGATVAHWSKSE